MSLAVIRGKKTNGVQIRVFREGRTITKFLSFAKHGGIEKTMEMAARLEVKMEIEAGPRIGRAGPHRGSHTIVPNRNSTSGVPGIRAFIKDSRATHGRNQPTLHFSTTWCEWSGEERVVRTFQRSSREYGILRALQEVLNEREKGTGIRMPSARTAWNVIRQRLDSLPKA